MKIGMNSYENYSINIRVPNEYVTKCTRSTPTTNVHTDYQICNISVLHNDENLNKQKLLDKHTCSK